LQGIVIFAGMTDRNEILSKLLSYKKNRASVYGIESLGLFGSYARGEGDESSDVDVCIRLKSPDIHNMSLIKEELEAVLQREVDLVSLGSIMRPSFKRNLEHDARFV